MLVQDDEGGYHHLGNFRDGDSSGSDVFLACSEGMTGIRLTVLHWWSPRQQDGFRAGNRSVGPQCTKWKRSMCVVVNIGALFMLHLL